MKRNSIRQALVASAAALVAQASFAQGAISTPPPAPLGTTVELVVTPSPQDAADASCGFRIEFSDRHGFDVRVDRSTPFPVRLSYQYPRAGQFTATATGKRVMNRMPCTRSAQSTVVITPTGAAAAPAPVAPLAAELSLVCM